MPNLQRLFLNLAKEISVMIIPPHFPSRYRSQDARATYATSPIFLPPENARMPTSERLRELDTLGVREAGGVGISWHSCRYIKTCRTHISAFTYTHGAISRVGSWRNTHSGHRPVCSSDLGRNRCHPDLARFCSNQTPRADPSGR